MKRGIRILLITLSLGTVALVWVWHDRPDPAGVGLQTLNASTEVSGVRVTWLGVSTLLFDDGETQLLTDGFFSRPGLLDLAFDRPVVPDVAGIDRVLSQEPIERLAAVLTVHSHYDHAMDAPTIALRTGAVLMGSSSTANAGRGAGVPEAQLEITDGGATRSFGDFRVTFHPSRHFALDESGTPPFPGTIDSPLAVPAPISAWREGGSFSIEITHPLGTALVQGSAGFIAGALTEVRADVVFLGIGGVERRGRSYADAYWSEVVGATGASRVFPIHFDDFTRPYGDVRPFPRAFEDIEVSLGWLQELATTPGETRNLSLLPFREAVVLFPPQWLTPAPTGSSFRT